MIPNQRRGLLFFIVITLALSGGVLIDNTDMDTTGLILIVSAVLLILFAPFFTGAVK